MWKRMMGMRHMDGRDSEKLQAETVCASVGGFPS